MSCPWLMARASCAICHEQGQFFQDDILHSPPAIDMCFSCIVLMELPGQELSVQADTDDTMRCFISNHPSSQCCKTRPLHHTPGSCAICHEQKKNTSTCMFISYYIHYVSVAFVLMKTPGQEHCQFKLPHQDIYDRMRCS